MSEEKLEIRGLDFVLSKSRPWIVSYDGECARLEDALNKLGRAHSGLLTVVLDGGKMTTMYAFYDELTRKLELPSYFGRNLNALDEVVNDLEWLCFTAIVLVVDNAAHVLEHERSDKLADVFDILYKAGEEWHDPTDDGSDRCASPFHTILVKPNMDRIGKSGFPYDIPLLNTD